MPDVKPMPAPIRERARSGARPAADSERESRLPAWAQVEITRLRRALSEAREERDHALKAPVSNVSVLRSGAFNGDGPREVFLPDGAVVAFNLGTVDRPRVIEVNVNVSEHRRPVLRVSSNSGQVAVRPLASNCFTVEEVPRGE